MRSGLDGRGEASGSEPAARVEQLRREAALVLISAEGEDIPQAIEALLGGYPRSV